MLEYYYDEYWVCKFDIEILNAQIEEDGQVSLALVRGLIETGYKRNYADELFGWTEVFSEENIQPVFRNKRLWFKLTLQEPKEL